MSSIYIKNKRARGHLKRASSSSFADDLHIRTLPEAVTLLRRLDEDVDFGTFERQLRPIAHCAGEFVEPSTLLRECLKFLVLKKIARDEDAEILSPTDAIDAAWHQLLLNPRLYKNINDALGGEMIDHNPEGGRDVAARNERVARTIDMYKFVFFASAASVSGSAWKAPEELPMIWDVVASPAPADRTNRAAAAQTLNLGGEDGVANNSMDAQVVVAENAAGDAVVATSPPKKKCKTSTASYAAAEIGEEASFGEEDATKAYAAAAGVEEEASVEEEDATETYAAAGVEEESAVAIKEEDVTALPESTTPLRQAGADVVASLGESGTTVAPATGQSMLEGVPTLPPIVEVPAADVVAAQHDNLTQNLVHTPHNISSPLPVPKTKSLKENSLGLLCHNFLELFKDAPPYRDNNGTVIDILQVADQLGVTRRRIFDVINILASLNVVSRVKKNTYRWHGKGDLPRFFAKLQYNGKKELLGREAASAAAAAAEDGAVNTSATKKVNGVAQTCCKLIQIFLVSEPTEIGITEAAKEVSLALAGAPQTKVRRMYAVADVLQGMDILQKGYVRRMRSLRWVYPTLPSEMSNYLNTAAAPAASSENQRNESTTRVTTPTASVSSSVWKAPEELSSPDECMTIVADIAGEKTLVKCKKTTTISKLFSAIATRRGINVSSPRFILDGFSLYPGDMIGDVAEDGDVIYLCHPQSGC